jgi:hypothetical protein
VERIVATPQPQYGARIVAKVGEGNRIMASGSGVTAEDLRRQYHSTGSGMAIAEVQLDPSQLIVTDEAGQLYRVPFTIKGGTISFGDPVAVTAEFVDVAAPKIAAAAGGKETIMTKTTAAQAIRRAVERGAISPSRAHHYAALAAAGHDLSALGQLVTPPRSIRAAAPVRASYDDEGDEIGEEFRFMFPPDEWAKMRAGAERRAMIAAAYDDGDDDEFLHLYPMQAGQEAAWRASKAAADRLAASAAARRQAQEDQDYKAVTGEEPPS